MGTTTAIEWTDHTFNLWRGCGKVHTGCKNCYAEKQAKRNPKILGEWGPEGTRIMAAADYKRQPIAWNKQAEAEGVRRKVFALSMGDVFEDREGPIHDHFGNRVFIMPTGAYMMTTNEDAHALEEWRAKGVRPATLADLRAELFRIIDATPWLDWQLVTKRPENIRRMYLPHLLENVPGHVRQNEGDGKRIRMRPNVWLGTSVSDQATAEKMIYDLLRNGADLSPVLFLSAEPLLGPIDLIMALGEARRRLGYLNKLNTPTIRLVIAGGESGDHARPMHPDWVRSLRDQCQAAGVPFFFKQWGEHLYHSAIWNQTTAEANRMRDLFSKAIKAGKQWPVLTPGRTDQSESLYLVGKEAAGNLLDGQTYLQFPEVTHASV